MPSSKLLASQALGHWVKPTALASIQARAAVTLSTIFVIFIVIIIVPVIKFCHHHRHLHCQPCRLPVFTNMRMTLRTLLGSRPVHIQCRTTQLLKILALITRFWRSGWELCDFNNHCLDVWKCVAGKKIRDNESKLMEILMKMILTAMMMILISS